ncbi:hypothetical protein TNCT_111731 [Trichonephila clavata]|uniref:Uncharacterized protein n=1 Tax=Trichonephila clavata TaxID=2740835 RepID=A0A8X6JAR9_TRICU|nr:hypothetical protein TNCT_111731 [Trichonephila clavata]
MDAVFEIKKLFADYPFLLELGKQLRAVREKTGYMCSMSMLCEITSRSFYSFSKSKDKPKPHPRHTRPSYGAELPTNRTACSPTSEDFTSLRAFRTTCLFPKFPDHPLTPRHLPPPR